MCEADGISKTSSSDTEVEEPKKRQRTGSLKKDQGSLGRRGSKQMKETKKEYSTTSGDDPDLESDARTPKKLISSKKRHKDSDFFASSDSDFKEHARDERMTPVQEDIQVGFLSSIRS